MKTVAIIGGAGKMGKWFSQFFLKQGYKVIISGRNKQKLINLSKKIPVEITENNIKAIENAGFIIISVLFQNFEHVVSELAPFVKDNQIVWDITSLKVIPVEIMHRYIKKGTILGTHPVFGPSVKNTKQNFILTPINKNEERYSYELKKWLEERDFKVSIMSPQKHDQLMTVILGLSHFIGLTVADTWLELNINFKELLKNSGPSFRTLLKLVENVVSTDPNFYSVLQMSLDVDKVENLFQNKVEKWLKIIKNKDKIMFIKDMKNLKEKFEKVN